MSIASMFGADERPLELPTEPNTAFFLGCLFTRLGGFFSITSRGDRGLGRPLGAALRLGKLDIPQLPNAEPHEQFRSEAEWEGALKLIEALIQRLSKEDQDFLFDALAPAAVDERGFVPSIEEPTRRTA